ncbi:hypothetical protein HYR54_07525 [Candidatus Acetothermia bacterium]|nr:hypothetical protein [Candidatus Acetothermia bacterium]
MEAFKKKEISICLNRKGGGGGGGGTDKPDLVIDIMSLNTSPKKDEAVSIFVVIRNASQVKVENSFRLSLFVNGNESPPYTINGGLGAGMSMTYEMKWQANCGDTSIKVFVDSRQEVAESNESNNEMNKSVSVSGCTGSSGGNAAVEILGIAATLNTMVGETGTMVVDLVNNGEADAPSSTYYFDLSFIDLPAKPKGNPKDSFSVTWGLKKSFTIHQIHWNEGDGTVAQLGTIPAHGTAQVTINFTVPDVAAITFTDTIEVTLTGQTVKGGISKKNFDNPNFTYGTDVAIDCALTVIFTLMDELAGTIAKEAGVSVEVVKAAINSVQLEIDVSSLIKAVQTQRGASFPLTLYDTGILIATLAVQLSKEPITPIELAVGATISTLIGIIQGGISCGKIVADEKIGHILGQAREYFESLKKLFDEDGDGVLNSADHCPGTPAETVVDATGCPPTAPVRVEEAVAFLKPHQPAGVLNAALFIGDGEILDAVSLWMGDKDVPWTGGKHLNIATLKNLLAHWVCETQIHLPATEGCMKNVVAQSYSYATTKDMPEYGALEVTRSLSGATVRKGETFTVLVNVKADRDIGMVAMFDFLPKGWQVEEHEANIGLFLDLKASETKSYSYSVKVPDDANAGVFNIRGFFRSDTFGLQQEGGDTMIEIVEKESTSILDTVAGSDGVIDDAEMTAALQMWQAQKPLQNIGTIISDAQIIQLIAHWKTKTPFNHALSEFNKSLPVAHLDRLLASQARNGIASVSGFLIEVFGTEGRLLYTEEFEEPSFRQDIWFKVGPVPNGIYIYVLSMKGPDGKVIARRAGKLVILR